MSSKLQLCSCKGSAQSLKHYWVFHRFDKSKKNVIVGEAMLPSWISPEDDRLNKQVLLQLLNHENIFDSDIRPAEKDRLLLSFSIGPNGECDRMNYGFQFTNNQWKHEEYDPLEWEWRHNEEKAGRIKNAIQ